MANETKLKINLNGLNLINAPKLSREEIRCE